MAETTTLEKKDEYSIEAQKDKKNMNFSFNSQDLSITGQVDLKKNIYAITKDNSDILYVLNKKGLKLNVSTDENEFSMNYNKKGKMEVSFQKDGENILKYDYDGKTLKIYDEENRTREISKDGLKITETNPETLITEITEYNDFEAEGMKHVTQYDAKGHKIAEGYGYENENNIEYKTSEGYDKEEFSELKKEFEAERKEKKETREKDYNNIKGQLDKILDSFKEGHVQAYKNQEELKKTMKHDRQNAQNIVDIRTSIIKEYKNENDSKQTTPNITQAFIQKKNQNNI